MIIPIPDKLHVHVSQQKTAENKSDAEQRKTDTTHSFRATHPSCAGIPLACNNEASCIKGGRDRGSEKPRDTWLMGRHEAQGRHSKTGKRERTKMIYFPCARPNPFVLLSFRRNARNVRGKGNQITWVRSLLLNNGGRKGSVVLSSL